MEISEDFDQLVERTRATVEKYRERAEELREELRQARAGRKVQIMAMIDRLERKYDGAKEKLETIAGNSAEDAAQSLGDFHQKVVSELSDMKRTIDERIR
jgi:DNA anti-recombination protein RmuC